MERRKDMSKKQFFKEHPQTKTILVEMFKRAGLSVNRFNFNKPGWYLSYAWTEQEENDFKDWIVKFLKTNPQARQELMAFPSANTAFLKRVAGEFVFNYGWKIKKEPATE